MESTEIQLTEIDFAIPVEIDLIEKAGSSDSEDWNIEGISSVEIPDLQDEVLVIKGMDISYLEEHGLFNWNHGKSPGAIVGEITKATKLLEEKPAKLFVKGTLYKSVPAAQDLRTLMKAIGKDSPTGKKMRMSLEGKATLRNGKRVVKSKIHNIALTMQPINTEAYAVLTKGMCHHADSDECMHCDETCFQKALEAPPAEQGAVITKQSLEGAKKMKKKKCKDCSCGGDENGGECKTVKKAFTKDEALGMIKSRFGYDDDQAERMYALIEKAWSDKARLEAEAARARKRSLTVPPHKSAAKAGEIALNRREALKKYIAGMGNASDRKQFSKQLADAKTDEEVRHLEKVLRARQ